MLQLNEMGVDGSLDITLEECFEWALHKIDDNLSAKGKIIEDLFQLDENSVTHSYMYSYTDKVIEIIEDRIQIELDYLLENVNKDSFVIIYDFFLEIVRQRAKQQKVIIKWILPNFHTRIYDLLKFETFILQIPLFIDPLKFDSFITKFSEYDMYFFNFNYQNLEDLYSVFYSIFRESNLE